MRPDVVLRGGLVVDGTAAPGVPRDVGVTGGLISGLAPAGTLRGHTEIDATGLVVTPGFVDIHSHADVTVLDDGRAHSALLQGVTSIVTGNCGYGAAPLDDASAEAVGMQVPGWRPATRPGWRSFEEYLDLLRHNGVAVNVFPLLAHGTLRLRVVGFAPRPATAAEIADLAALTRDAMAAGAVGFSTGLEYAPGSAATRAELRAISAAVGAHDGLYATHCRNRSARIVASAAEAIDIAAAGACRLQLSHFLARPSFPDRSPYKRAVELGRTAECEVLFDAFPFTHGPTPLALLLPTWARAGTRADIADRLADPRGRARIEAAFDDRFLETVRSGVAAEMYVASDGVDGAAVGRSLARIAGDRSIPAAVLNLLAAAGENFAGVTVVERWATTTDLHGALADDDYLIMGDGVTACLDGDQAGHGFSLSDWGYAPAMLARFVRDQGLLTLERAVHRMTSAPARQAGIADRGVVAVGSAADLVAFDLAELGGTSDPSLLGRPPTGIRHVLVNGRVAVRSGRVTGELAGRVGLPR